MAELGKAATVQLSELGAYLGPGTKANGRLVFEGITTIEGEVEGEILVHGNVTVGEHATINGKIACSSAVIRGKVTANIEADKRIEIHPPGIVLGDITTQSLVIGDGAVLEGHCSMRKEKEGKVLPLLRPEATEATPEKNPS